MVAALLGKILQELGLRNKALEKTTGEELVRMGADKASQLFSKAMGGVLIIDEAHKLDPKVNAEGVAIASQLLKLADENKNEITIMLIGYKDEIDEKLIEYDDGFRSRFENGFIECDDYSLSEFAEIFKYMCDKNKFTPEHEDVINVAARKVARGRGNKGFGNARNMEKLVDIAYERALSRDAQTSTFTMLDILGPRPDRNNIAQLDLALTSLEENFVGLLSIKNNIMQLVDLAGTNYDRELRGEEPYIVPINHVFLGNPGTGKTSVAKLYADIMKHLGFLSKGGWEYKKSADLIGDAVGVTQKKTASILKRCEGKTLIIDEAYTLNERPYGHNAIDTIVGVIHGAPGEDICCILIGYDKEMQKMFRDANDGLSRRFDLPNAWVFEDYSESELEDILADKLKAKNLKMSRDVRRAVVKKIYLQRYQPKFGNAGVVDNILGAGQSAQSKRDPNSKELLLVDFSLDDASQSLGDWRSLLVGLIKVDDVIKQLESIESRIMQCKRDDKDPRDYLSNFVFVGPPGTGKTTIALAMSKMLQELNVVNNKFKNTSALNLQAGYTGQTPIKVNEILDETAGGVLFIDEAYNFATGTQFAKESCDTLLPRIEPSVKERPVVILAGYNDDLESMFNNVNEGFRRRFEEKIIFPEWDAEDCLEFVRQKCVTDGYELLIEAADLLLAELHEIQKRPNWANAGDAVSAYKYIFNAHATRQSKTPSRGNSYTTADVADAMLRFKANRPEGQCGTSKVPTIIASTPLMSINEFVDSVVDKKKEAVVEDTIANKSSSDTNSNDLNPVFAALLEACREAGYDDSHIKRKELVDILEAVYNEGKDLPDNILDIVFKKTEKFGIKSTLELMKLLKPQIPIVLDGMSTAVRAEEERLLEVQRMEEEAAKAAVQAEKQRILNEIAQKQAHREQIQYKLKSRGLCCMGFSWHPDDNGRWRCAGGSHICYESDL